VLELVVYESNFFFKELEQIEEHWRQESHDLVAMVTRLQEENRKLSSSLAESQDHLPDEAGDCL
jgi:predicted DNA-binding ribbon-helix-helix protein